MMGNKIKKDKFIIFAAIIAVLVILLSAFLIIPQIHHASTQNQPSKPTEPLTDYYLLYEGNISKIFVVSANASYGNYPYSSRSNSNGVQLAENGEPCYIINVTIRNDYSTLMYVWLTAQLFNGKNQINATDLLLNGLPPSGGAMVGLNSGENGNLSLYLGTNNTDVTSFQIVARIITGVLIP